jgi:archaellum biogenesis ATPase FlaH
MTTLRDMEILHPKILIYGAAGTGKTALALTAGDVMQIMDLDNGLMTGKTLLDEFQENRLSVDVIPDLLESDPTKGTGFLKAKTALYKIVSECKKGSYPFKVLGVDSLTSLADGAMRWVQGNANHIGKNPQLQEYGLAFNEIENFLMMLKSLPIMVVVTAHQHEIEVDSNVQIRVAVPGRKLPGKICGWFDEVWRLRIQNLQGGKTGFVIQTKGTASTLARSRFNLGDKLDASMGLRSILKTAGYEI